MYAIGRALPSYFQLIAPDYLPTTIVPRDNTTKLSFSSFKLWQSPCPKMSSTPSRGKKRRQNNSAVTSWPPLKGFQCPLALRSLPHRCCRSVVYFGETPDRAATAKCHLSLFERANNSSHFVMGDGTSKAMYCLGKWVGKLLNFCFWVVSSCFT